MPPKRTNKIGYAKALGLRKAKTLAESKLWHYLKLGELELIHFRQQHAIGPYIVDFCTVKEKLVIELDGSQHIDQEDYDIERTIFLSSKGYKVIRIWNNDVMNNIDGVIQTILDEIVKNRSSPDRSD